MKYFLDRACTSRSINATCMESESDELVAARVQQGDTEAFGVLVDRYEPKMSRYAQRFLSHYEDREDAVQDVFLRAYERIQSYRSTERFSPWLYRVAHNVYVNLIRSRGREKVRFVDLDTFFPAGIPDETQPDMPDVVDMAPFIATLDPKYREAIVLFYYEEKSYEDIAAILQIPKATVGVRLARARAALKKIMPPLI